MSRDIFLRLLFSIFIVLLIFALHRAITVGPRPAHAATDTARPWLIADRGGAGLAPENTLEAIQESRAYAIDAIRVDARPSSDGSLVLFQDDTLERTTNGIGEVRSQTVADLKRLDAGYRFTIDDGNTFPYRDQAITIPTLTDVMAAYPDLRLILNLHDLDVTAIENLIQAIRSDDAVDRIIIMSDDDAMVETVRSLAPEIATAATAGELRLFHLLTQLHLWRLHRPLGDVYIVPPQWENRRLDTPEFIGAANSLNQPVFYLVEDNAEVMNRLLNAGASAIITTRPDLAPKPFSTHGTN